VGRAPPAAEQPSLVTYGLAHGKSAHDRLAAIEREGPGLVTEAYYALYPEKKGRQTAALEAAMAELGTKEGTIVTRNESARIVTGAGTIEVVPVWRFLLDQPDAGE
jgi:hypothetical protein